MINVYIYDKQTGEIRRSFFSTDPDALALNLQEGEASIAEDPSVKNPYVVDGKLETRPAFNEVISGTTISNLPNGTTLETNDQTFVVTGGTAELGFQLPGTYEVRLTLFPYVEKTVEVTQP